MEGLLTSLGIISKQLLTGENLKDIDPQRKANAKLMLHDLLVMFLAMLFGLLLFSKDKKVEGSTSN